MNNDSGRSAQKLDNNFDIDEEYTSIKNYIQLNKQVAKDYPSPRYAGTDIYELNVDKRSRVKMHRGRQRLSIFEDLPLNQGATESRFEATNVHPKNNSKF